MSALSRDASVVRDNNNLILLGGEIRRLRKARKLTQADLAGHSDVAENFIGMIERGERAVSLPTLFAIADALAVPPGDLFRGFGLQVESSDQTKA